MCKYEKAPSDATTGSLSMSILLDLCPSHLRISLINWSSALLSAQPRAKDELYVACERTMCSCMILYDLLRLSYLATIAKPYRSNNEMSENASRTAIANRTSESPLRPKPFKHHKVVYPKSLYTGSCLHHKAFSTGRYWHPETFFTRSLSHRKSLYTRHQKPFASQSSCTKTSLHQSV